ncbi:MAG: hypothetical protein JOZ24_02765 [Candidatus Eremiobacteraeota bacterium]|nr:hypothetical protein [Candidatus Eremiobacteraeota bacterium]
MTFLTVHLYVGFVVCALALIGVWRRPERRITLYVVTLQLLLGIVLAARGLRVPPLHIVLAILGWAGYMIANALARRTDRARLALLIAGLSSLLILIAFAIGHGAVRSGA